MKTRTRLSKARLATTLIGAAVLMSALPGAAHAADSKFESLATAPLARGSGYEYPNGSKQVRHLQRQLRRLGERPGPIDGLFGPLTEGAVRRFQHHAALRVDGLVGPKTGKQLDRKVAKLHREAIKRARLTRNRPHIHRSLAANDGRASGGSANRHPERSTAEPADHTPIGWPSDLAVLLVAICVTPLVALLLLATLRSRRKQARRPAESEQPEPREVATEPDRMEEFPPPAAARTQRFATTEEEGETAARKPSGTPVIGYVSVPERERVRNGEEYEAQANAIVTFCRRRGLRLVRMVRDVESTGSRAADAPGLQHACEALARGEAQGLAVQSLRRLTRSPARLSLLLRWLADAERALIAIENKLDTSTPVGSMIADSLIEVGDWDRERAARRRGPTRATSTRPAVRDVPELHARIAAMREEGLSLHAIADTLNAEGVPTLRGGAYWRASSVQAAVGYKRPTARNGVGGLTLPRRPAGPDEEAER